MPDKKFPFIRLDLFKLHDPRDNTKNWLFAKGSCLKDELKRLIESAPFSKTELVKHLMKNLDMSISSAERLVYFKKEWYPLAFIKEIVSLIDASRYFTIQNEIEFLKSSKPPVVEYKAVKELSIDLCKIVGAHSADGTLRDAYIAITDYHKSTILALINWFKEFGYAQKLRRIGENEYGIKFHSRIISRYLTKLFGFPSGCKQYTVGEPEILRNAPLEFRKAFALGALTFEAGVGITNKIELCVASKAFRDSISNILTKLNISHKTMEKQSGGYWRLWGATPTKDEIVKWMELFEPNTEKWFKLRDYVTGFSKGVGSVEEALKIFNTVYPKQSASKVTLTSVLLAIKALEKTHRYELARYLANKNSLSSYGGKWAHSLKHYLDILKRAGIISVGRGRFGKKKSFGTIVREVYTFNRDIADWRLPERPSAIFLNK